MSLRESRLGDSLGKALKRLAGEGYTDLPLRPGLKASRGSFSDLSDSLRIFSENGLCPTGPFWAQGRPYYLPRSPWPPRPSKSHGLTKQESFIYLGVESLRLWKWVEDEWLCHRQGTLESMRALDLGCGSGFLATQLAIHGVRSEGWDLNELALQWFQAFASAQGLPEVPVRWGDVVSLSQNAGYQEQFDLVVSNPPLAVNRSSRLREQPSLARAAPFEDRHLLYREGGETGIELPLAFLSAAGRVLKRGGCALFLVTNPQPRQASPHPSLPAPSRKGSFGKTGLFFEALSRMPEAGRWQWVHGKCLDQDFNRDLAREDGYEQRGIKNIELWALHLKKSC